MGHSMGGIVASAARDGLRLRVAQSLFSPSLLHAFDSCGLHIHYYSALPEFYLLKIKLTNDLA
jgi:hypothetical protein